MVVVWAEADWEAVAWAAVAWAAVAWVVAVWAVPPWEVALWAVASVDAVVAVTERVVLRNGAASKDGERSFGHRGVCFW